MDAGDESDGGRTSGLLLPIALTLLLAVGLAIGRVGCCLLMAHEYMLDFFLSENRIVDMESGATRVAENAFDPLVGQCPYQHVSAGEFLHFYFLFHWQLFASNNHQGNRKPPLQFKSGRIVGPLR